MVIVLEVREGRHKNNYHAPKHMALPLSIDCGRRPAFGPFQNGRSVSNCTPLVVALRPELCYSDDFRDGLNQLPRLSFDC
jgi:hypothetical protein